MNVRPALAVSGLCGLMLSCFVRAEVPHTFVAGTAARASEVNENFQSVDQSVTLVAEAMAAMGLNVELLSSGVDALGNKVDVNSSAISVLSSSLTANSLNVTALRTDLDNLGAGAVLQQSTITSL